MYFVEFCLEVLGKIDGRWTENNVAFWITWQRHYSTICSCHLLLLKNTQNVCFKWTQRSCARLYIFVFRFVCERFHSVFDGNSNGKTKEKYTRCQVVNENCIACRSRYCIQRVPFAHLLLSCVFRRCRCCLFVCVCVWARTIYAILNILLFNFTLACH